MIVQEKHIKKLCQHPLFLDCSSNALLEVLRENKAETMLYRVGDIIMSPSTEQKMIGMILSGKAAVTTPDAAGNSLLRNLAAGDLFGVANLFVQQPYVSVIRATSPCEVLCVPETAIRALIERDSAFCYRYLSFLSGRVCYLNQKIAYLTAGTPERRLALYLVSLRQRTVELPLSISALSEILDVGRASLYRAFDKLTEDGFIQKEGRTFILLDPDRMLTYYR